MKRFVILFACLGAWVSSFSQVPVPVVSGELQPVWVTDQREVLINPDDHAISGGSIPGIGAPETRHSSLVTSVRALETLDSNPAMLSTNDGGYQGFTSGGVALQWSQFFGRDSGIFYSGAVRYDSRARLQDYSQLTNAHSLAATKNLRFGTWNLLFDDQARYSQGSSFGAGGMEGMGVGDTTLLGSQMPMDSLRPELVPNQSVLVGRVGAITNTVLAELDAHLSMRDTVTASVSYGLLHFDTNQLPNANQVSAVTGYDRRLSARDTIAFEAAAARFTYQNPSGSIETEYGSALYARHITGSLSFTAGAGPEIVHLLLAAGAHKQELDWQGRATLQYSRQHGSVSLTSMRAVTGGSGVVAGARNIAGQGTVTVAYSPAWSSSLSAGLSRTRDLSSLQSFDLLYSEVVLNHRLGRRANVFLLYDLQRQTHAAQCTGPACAYGGMRNVFGVGLGWEADLLKSQ